MSNLWFLSWVAGAFLAGYLIAELREQYPPHRMSEPPAEIEPLPAWLEDIPSDREAVCDQIIDNVADLLADELLEEQAARRD